MIFSKNILFCIVVYCWSSIGFAQYIVVDDTYTAQKLVENVLINSTCANVSNFSVSGGNFGTNENSFGYFKSGTSNFPFQDGIVLSTSKAISTQGPNSSTLSDDATGWSGDSDLEQALNISNTSNATILEFDFTPLTSKISFDYIFSSEEYHDTAPCKYSDGFAFLLKIAGSATDYQNLAIVPNTSTPVKVTTVHPEISGGCPSENPAYFGSYNGTDSPTNFNGQTTSMTAKATVIPGTKYHIKIVIADETNPQYDSAIFLKGGSFNVGTDLGPNQLIATQNPVCEGKKYTLDATETGNNTYKWYQNGNLISDATNPLYDVTSAGIYKVEVGLGSSTCTSSGEVTIEYSPLPNLIDTKIVQCDEDKNGKTLFNLSKVSNIIKNNDLSLGDLTFYENRVDAENQNVSKAITNSNNYESIAKTIYASVSNAFSCSNVANVELKISSTTLANHIDIESCDLDGVIDGYYDFDLSSVTPKVLSGLPSGLIVEYYETLSDALLQNNPLQNSYRNTIRYKTILYAKILNGSDCYGIIPIKIYVNSLTPDNFKDEVAILCPGHSVTLEVAQTFSSYSWSNDDKDYSTKINSPGDYTITVTDENTCEATKKFTIIPSEIAKITAVDIDDFNENGNSILIHYTGQGLYEFSIDGVNYQDSPSFENISAGEYTVWVRDKNGCGKTSKKIYVLNYPKFFTPNSDGYNDVWNIENLSIYPNAKVSIFDRYGKLIYQFKGNKKGWDGKYNSFDLPSTDYWFVITLENEKMIKGHFALLR